MQLARRCAGRNNDLEAVTGNLTSLDTEIRRIANQQNRDIVVSTVDAATVVVFAGRLRAIIRRLGQSRAMSNPSAPTPGVADGVAAVGSGMAGLDFSSRLSRLIQSGPEHRRLVNEWNRIRRRIQSIARGIASNERQFAAEGCDALPTLRGRIGSSESIFGEPRLRGRTRE